MSFIQQRGAQFADADQAFYFSGANVYYLTYKSKFMVDAVLDTAQALGLRVIRTWGFLDMGSLDGNVLSVAPPGPKEGVYFHYWDSTVSAPAFNDGPNGLEHLDYVISAAGQRGLRLILPLVNNWTDYGGIDQYVAWYGLASHNDFFSNRDTRQAYKDWTLHLLNRDNVYTGLRYRNDETIMAWELTNEARCVGDKESLFNWVAEMSAFIKEADPNHIVGVGDEGFFSRASSNDWTYDGSRGADFEAFLGIPTIDFGTFHLYPDSWLKPVDFGSYWIDDHLAAGDRAGKPVVLTEYGLQDKAIRDNVYRDWLDRIYARAGAGDLFWMLADKQDDGTLYPDFDQFTLYSSSVPESIRLHAAQMAARA